MFEEKGNVDAIHRLCADKNTSADQSGVADPDVPNWIRSRYARVSKMVKHLGLNSDDMGKVLRKARVIKLSRPVQSPRRS